MTQSSQYDPWTYNHLAQLGPEPIPFPSSQTSGGNDNTGTSQASSHLTSGNASNVNKSGDASAAANSYLTMRPPPGTGASGPTGAPNAPQTTPQKKDMSALSAPSLGALGPASGASVPASHYSSYSLPTKTTATTFPSPPSVPFSQQVSSWSFYSIRFSPSIF